MIPSLIRPALTQAVEHIYEELFYDAQGLAWLRLEARFPYALLHAQVLTLDAMFLQHLDQEQRILNNKFKDLLWLSMEQATDAYPDYAAHVASAVAHLKCLAPKGWLVYSETTKVLVETRAYELVGEFLLAAKEVERHTLCVCVDPWIFNVDQAGT